MMSGELSNYRFIQAEAFESFWSSKRNYMLRMFVTLLYVTKLRKNDDRIMTLETFPCKNVSSFETNV